MLPNFKSILRREFLARTIVSLNPAVAVSVSPSVPLRDVLQLFIDKRIGSVVVGDRTDLPEGILTERDFITKFSVRSDLTLGMPASEITTNNPEILAANASIARAIYLMACGHYRHLPIRPATGRPTCMISIKNIVDAIHQRLTKKILADDPALMFDTNAVDRFFASAIEVLTPEEPVCVSEDSPVAEVVARLAQKGRGAVIVQGKSQSVSGIFSERDFLRQVLQPERTYLSLPVSTVMTKAPTTILRGTSVAYAFGLLSEGGYRHLPIVDEFERPLGMVSVRVILSFLADAILHELQEMGGKA